MKIENAVQESRWGLKLTKSKLSGSEQKVAIEDVIEKVSLEESLPAGEPDETVSLETNEPGMRLGMGGVGHVFINIEC